jgi:phosphatidylglycerophosphate synthase
MTTAAAQPIAGIVGTSSVQLWGLDGAARLRRQLRAVGITAAASGDAIPPRTPALLLRGDYLFDERTLRDLATTPATILVAQGAAGTTAAVAAHVDADALPQARAIVDGTAGPDSLPGAHVRTPATLSPAFVGHLLKSAPPVVLPIRPEHVGKLERHLFDGSYKGVTDLVTKWVWPPPARWATRWCVRLGISPNAVTATSLVLAIATMILFARGQFAAGLVLAWIMTFLDTVDGKLARVTVTSTRFGHFFDHIIDLIHPPLWYFAWGYGAAGSMTDLRAYDTTLIVILAGYIVGRLVEGAFDNFLADFSLFVWRPVDSYMRLITARRNPNLILLSLFAVARLPIGGLIAVAVWTLASTVFLTIRLVQAAYARTRHGRLHSWIAELPEDATYRPAYARPFTPPSGTSKRLA